jgi:enediyne biosynthesis protein E4
MEMIMASRWGTVLVGVCCVLAGVGQVAGGELEFADVALASGVQVTHATSGFDHPGYTAGGAAADFNNDGWQDLFVIGGGNNNQADHLFINLGDGTFADQAGSWGVDALHKGKGVAPGDFNGDGWMDLFVSSSGPSTSSAPGHHKLYRNNGDNTFTNIAAEAGVAFTTTTVEDGFGAAWGDYDLDGDLDLIVAGFEPGNVGTKIFRNNGDESFTDVTDATGIFDGVPFGARALTPRFVDMDGDWYPDVLLVADFGTSRYFKNNADGTFSDVSFFSGTTQEENGMGQCVGDFNKDGLLDWYVTSIYNGTFWTGNKLYFNLGNHQYEERAEELGVDDGGYGWAALAVDVNHDARLDIVETNGGGSPPYFNEQSYLWLMNPDGTFTESALGVGFQHFRQGRGMVRFDFDNDGDQDIAIFSNNDVLMLFENRLSGDDVNWLRVFLDTSGYGGLAPNGYGARIRVVAGGDAQYSWISSGDHFLSHSEMSAHFGLGGSDVVGEITIDWPDGSSTTVMNVAVNQTLRLRPESGGPGDLDLDGDVDANDFGSFVDCVDGPNVVPSLPPCSNADLDGDDDVDFHDFAVLQRLVTSG